MKSAAIIILFMVSHSLVMAQSFTESKEESDAVRKTVMTLFDGMEAADGEILRSVLSQNATLHTVSSNETGAELVETPIEQFIESVDGAEPGTLIEQILYISVNVDGDLATAWMDYRFYRGDEFSHCGANSMNLIKKEGNWRIFSIVDTRHRENCPDPQ
jgi:hypothetical protein